MKKQIAEIIVLILVVIPFIAAGIFWQQLPGRMLVHFNFKGEADGYAGSPMALLLLPIVNVLVYVVLIFLPKLMAASEHYELLAKRYLVIRLTLHGFICLLYLVILFYNLYHNANLFLFLIYGLLLFMLITGNNLNNIRPNHFIGVRTSWTMKNPEVWRRTHHLASRLWVVSSLIMMCLIPFLSQLQFVRLSVMYLFAVSLVPVVYSWVIYKKIKTI